MKQFREKIGAFFFMTTAFFLMPAYVHAVALLPECASGSGFGNCSTCDFLALFANAADIILQFLGVAVLVTLIIGGAIWILSAGNDTMVQKGKAIIAGSVVGTLIVLGAYFIVNAVMASLLGDGDFENVQLFGSKNWDKYCEAKNPVPTTTAASSVAVSTDTDPGKACVGKLDGVSCSTTTCGDHCQCQQELCVSICEEVYFGQNASCVSDAGACSSGSNGGAGLCPDAKSFCCVQGGSSATVETATEDEIADAECVGLGAGDECETDSCTDGCVCNDSSVCVNYCEYLNNVDGVDAMCVPIDECAASGGVAETSDLSSDACSASEICCSYISK